jgi:hypothetical protein
MRLTRELHGDVFLDRPKAHAFAGAELSIRAQLPAIEAPTGGARGILLAPFRD